MVNRLSSEHRNKSNVLRNHFTNHNCNKGLQLFSITNDTVYRSPAFKVINTQWILKISFCTLLPMTLLIIFILLFLFLLAYIIKYTYRVKKSKLILKTSWEKKFSMKFSLISLFPITFYNFWGFHFMRIMKINCAKTHRINSLCLRDIRRYRFRIKNNFN